MSTEHALEVARYHLDKAESKGLERYWLAVCRSLKEKLATESEQALQVGIVMVQKRTGITYHMKLRRERGAIEENGGNPR